MNMRKLNQKFIGSYANSCKTDIYENVVNTYKFRKWTDAGLMYLRNSLCCNLENYIAISIQKTALNKPLFRMSKKQLSMKEKL